MRKTLLSLQLLISLILFISLQNHVFSQRTDMNFRPVVSLNEYDVKAVATLNDGKVLVGGFFEVVNGEIRPGLVRLQEDGTIDPTFKFDFGWNKTSSIIAILPLPDGKVLLGGIIEMNIKGKEYRGIIRINADGTLDESFQAPVNKVGDVTAIAKQKDGKIIVATYLQNGSLIRLDANGSYDESFHTGEVILGISGVLTQEDDKILVWGSFDNYQIGNNSHGARLVRLEKDGQRDLNFLPQGHAPNGEVATVAIQEDGKILVGGYFSYIAGKWINNLVRLNSSGSLDESFTATVSNWVSCIKINSDGKILIAGMFSRFNGATVTGPLVRAFPDGVRDTDFNPGTAHDMLVADMAIQESGNVFLGGTFKNFNGKKRGGFALITSNGSLVEKDYSFQLAGRVEVIAKQKDGKILIGGMFDQVNGEDKSRFARLNPDGSLDKSFSLPLYKGTPNTINVLPDDKILISGCFLSSSDGACKYLLRINANGTLDTQFNSKQQLNNYIHGVGVQSNGKIIIAGSFTSHGGVEVNNIARLNTDGTLDNTFNPGSGPNNSIRRVFILNDDKILIAGQFTMFNGFHRKNMVRLNPDGALDNTFVVSDAFYHQVTDMAITPDEKIIIGGITYMGGEYLGRIGRLNSSGSIDKSFNLNIYNAHFQINAVAVQSDNKVIVATNVPEAQLMRLNPDGTIDESFNGNLNRRVFTHNLVFLDEELYVFGDMKSVIDRPISGITKILLPAPAPVANEASAITHNSFQANWQAVENTLHYELDVSTDDFESFLSGYEAKELDGISDIVENLEPLTTYFYRIRAVSSNTYSNNSNVIEVKTASATSLSDNVRQDAFHIYPNPGTGSFYVSSSVNGEVYLKVYNIQSQLILEQKCTAGIEPLVFDLTGQHKGIYVVHLQAGNYHLIKKVIKN